MNRRELKILNELIDREISNFQAVSDRTNKSHWLDRVSELQEIKSKLNYKYIDAQIELESSMNEQILNYINQLEK
jgi:hypothetical protein